MSLVIKNNVPVCSRCSESIENMKIFITGKFLIDFMQDNGVDLDFEAYQSGDCGIISSFLMCPCGQDHVTGYELEGDRESLVIKVKKGK